MKLNYFKMLDKIGNNLGIVPVHLSRKSMVDDAISTGSLVCDLITGGGWPAGKWVTLFGKEASGKSSLLYHTLSDAIRQHVNTEFFDFEGSTDPVYLAKILNINLNEVFGLRKESGVWEIMPKCRYHQPDIGEVYFRYMHRILQTLPDKLPHNSKWYYVYDKKPKEDYDTKLYKNTNRFWVPAEDSTAQVVWFIDSLPAMLTEKNDEKDNSNEIALQARMFSRYIPLVKSRLARKRCAIVAVNQIRMKPMCLYYTARVLLSDGTYKSIGDIVNNKLKVEVMSYNFDKKIIESKKIINWYNNGRAKNNEFKRLVVPQPRPGSRSDFGITNDHFLYDENGNEVQMRNLRINDKILGLSSLQFNDDQMQVIYGSILGDGHLRTRSSGSELSIRHGSTQDKYCIFKKKILGAKEGKYNKFNEYEFCISKKLKILEQLDKESYKRDDKGILINRTLSPILLDNIDIRGLAIYYMDDGTLWDYGMHNSINDSNDRSGYRISFNIRKYSWEQGEILSNKFNSITNVEFKHYKGETYHHLRISGKQNVNNFLKLVAPYMDVSMKYKIGNFDIKTFSTYNWNLNYESREIEPFTISNIKDLCVRDCLKYRNRYDIEVEDNHNFFIDGILVHNSFGSPETEPGGIAPKQFSDIRLKCTSCANPFPGKSGQIEEEPCWDGVGIDKYRYVKVQTIKNKCFSPFRNSLMRIWMEEKGDSGRGLDPVFDTFQFLEETGMATRERGGYYTIHMTGPWYGKKFRWREFKELILNPNRVEVYNKYKLNIRELGEVREDREEGQQIVAKAIDLRSICKQQIKNELAFKAYFDKISGVTNISVSSNKKEDARVCGNCALFKKHENCLDVLDNQKGCDEWLSEEDEESLVNGEVN